MESTPETCENSSIDDTHIRAKTVIPWQVDFGHGYRGRGLKAVKSRQSGAAPGKQMNDQNNSSSLIGEAFIYAIRLTLREEIDRPTSQTIMVEPY